MTDQNQEPIHSKEKHFHLGPLGLWSIVVFSVAAIFFGVQRWSSHIAVPLALQAQVKVPVVLLINLHAFPGAERAQVMIPQGIRFHSEKYSRVQNVNSLYLKKKSELNDETLPLVIQGNLAGLLATRIEFFDFYGDELGHREYWVRFVEEKNSAATFSRSIDGAKLLAVTRPLQAAFDRWIEE